MLPVQSSVGNPPAPSGKTKAQIRNQPVDALRGAVIILMALDHVRDYISSAAMSFSPTDLSRTTAAIFLTRWITHFCAPVFAFTAGIGTYLWMRRNRTPAQLSRFLLTRGLWLIVLELTVLRLILFLDFAYRLPLLLNVIWMLGLCMIVMAALVHLPPRALALLSLAVIAGHNLLDRIPASRFGPLAWAWNILHQQGLFRVGGAAVIVAYPLVPWVAVMAAGFCLGPVLLWEPGRRRRFLANLGLGLTAGFLVLRALNLYGDPSRWSAQATGIFTALSFLNCTKYPPSLLFLMMTLGPALYLMARLERLPLPDTHPLVVFGRVPFFFFVVHFALVHAIAIALEVARYGWTNFTLLPPPSMGSPRAAFPTDFGYDLWVVYAVWIAVIAILYPVCRWYAGLKRRRHDWWLSYL